MRLRPFTGAAALVAVILLASFAGHRWNWWHATVLAQDPHPLAFAAVQPLVPPGRGVRIAARLIGPNGTPVTTNVVATAAALDMGPDGMPTMTATLTPVPSTEAGEIAFTADLPMAGRWALTLSATVAGRSEPLTGTVVFTAGTPGPAGTTEPAPGAKGRILYYRHPMGLPDLSPTPKKDSMGMDYIPVYEADVAGAPGSIRIAPEKVQRAGVRTAIVERRRLTRTVHAPATITADESRIAVLTAKFEGFVEELLVPVTGAEVVADQPLVRVWIESRDILQKQSDFLASLRGAAKRTNDVERAENNLRLFGIPQSAIDALRQSGEPVRVLTLGARLGGTVVEKPATNGMRFAAGDTLYRIVDLSTVWIMAQVAERDLPLVAVGQPVRFSVRGNPDAPAEGIVSFIYPELSSTTRTGTVRIVVANPDRKLRLGQYADVAIEAAIGSGPVIAVPDSAVLDSGRRRVAFVAKGDGLFEPRDLELGTRAGGLVEIRAGLAEGERIVVTGNFLVDAESNLRAALQSFAPPESAR